MTNWHPNKIEVHHVIQAARKWDKNGSHLNFKNSVRYDVEINKKLYAPKPIISLAYELATGEELTPKQFGGAIDGPWVKRLAKLGFTIYPKTDSSPVWPDQLKDTKYTEGHQFSVTVNRYERDPKARLACIKHWGQDCQVCKKSLKDRYGDIGKNFIHVHHLVPLATIKGKYVVDPKKDLLPVCPNCHAMLHSSGLSVLQLRKLAKNA